VGHADDSYRANSTTSTKYVAFPGQQNYVEFSDPPNQYGNLPRSSGPAPLQPSELPYGEMPKSSEGDSYQALSIGESPLDL
jgi:hypothetical protein